MKKKWVITLALILFGLVLLGLLALDRSELYSEPYQKQIVDEVARQLHWDLKLDSIRLRPIKGVDLLGITVSSRDVRPNPFLKAQRLRLRYHLWEAVFHRKIILEEFRLDAPTMEIDLSEPVLPPIIPNPSTPASSPSVKLIEPNSSSTPVPNTDPASTEEALRPLPPSLPLNPISSLKKGSYWPSPQPIDLRKIMIDDGILSLILPGKDKIFLNSTHLEASLSADPIPTGTGIIICQTAVLPPNLKLSESRINFVWRGDSISIPKMSSLIFHGAMEGSFKAEQTQPDLPFDLQLAATNLFLNDVVQSFQIPFKQPWGDPQGYIQSRAHFQGSMLNPLMSSGQGIIQVDHFQLIESPSLVFLGGLINRPDLRNYKADKCEVDFILQSGRLQIPRIEILSKDIQLLGSGWINLVEKTEEFQLKLALNENLAKRLPSSLLEGISPRVDGFHEIPFRIWGSLKNPENDIEARFKGLAAKAIGGALFDQILESLSNSQGKSP